MCIWKQNIYTKVDCKITSQTSQLLLYSQREYQNFQEIFFSCEASCILWTQMSNSFQLNLIIKSTWKCRHKHFHSSWSWFHKRIITQIDCHENQTIECKYSADQFKLCNISQKQEERERNPSQMLQDLHGNISSAFLEYSFFRMAIIFHSQKQFHEENKFINGW